MAVPKKRTPSARRDRRRSHLALKSYTLAKCPQCQGPVQPHRVCPQCGFYKGKDVLKIEARKAKKAAKKKAKEDRRDKKKK